jgi:hypothetical protein
MNRQRQVESSLLVPMQIGALRLQSSPDVIKVQRDRDFKFDVFISDRECGGTLREI